MSSKPLLGLLLACSGSLAGAQAPQPAPNALPQPAPIVPAANMGVGMLTVSPTPLKFRDSSKPLTIGEMSDMAAHKAQTEFLQRQGFSSEEPPKPVAAPKQKPTLSVQALALWGGSTNQAEILINGRLMRVKGGETLAPGVSVDSVTPAGVTLAIAEATNVKSRRKPTTQKETTLRTIKAGQSAEISL
jgi:hypothetical protein